MDLSKFSTEDLCEIYDKISSWEWDERIGQKPKNFDNMPLWKEHFWQRKVHTRFFYLEPIYKQIKHKVGEKKLLHYHHIHNLHRTEEQFQEWWENQLYAKSH